VTRKPSAPVSATETAVRVTPAGDRVLFLADHRDETIDVTACASGVDLLTGARIERAQPLRLEPRGAVVLREDAVTGPGTLRAAHP